MPPPDPGPPDGWGPGSVGAGPPPPPASPNPNNCPSATGSGTAKGDNVAGQQLKGTFDTSNTQKAEAYGWIYQDSAGKLYNTSPQFAPFNANNQTVSIPVPPTYDGMTPIGVFHTHPDGPEDTDAIDTTTGTHFSPQDQQYAHDYGIEMYVAVNVKDINGVNLHWYSWDPGQDPTAKSKENDKGLLRGFNKC